MRHRLIFGAALLAILVAASGCASRGWVREIEGHVTQHAQRIDMESRRVDAMGQRVDGLGQRVQDLDGRVGQLARHHHASNLVDTLEVTFPFGKADLNDGAMTRLHELAKELRGDTRLALELVGYTDSRGSREYNVQLAQRRVEAVRRYLVQQGVPVSRIAAIGLGPLNERGVADAKKRRVSVHVTAPETMVTVATNEATGGASPAARDVQGQ
jgi:outer membrane protein OmpA-like peptidoglycan-associated protein